MFIILYRRNGCTKLFINDKVRHKKYLTGKNCILTQSDTTNEILPKYNAIQGLTFQSAFSRGTAMT